MATFVVNNIPILGPKMLEEKDKDFAVTFVVNNILILGPNVKCDLTVN